MKCNYCENEATVKDYREQDGITGRVLVCIECFNLNNEGCKNRAHQMTKIFKECFTFNEVDNVLDSAFQDFWDTVNAEIFKIDEEASQTFKDEMDIEAHNDTIERWRDKFISKVSKKLKKSVKR